MKDLIAKLQMDANCALGAIWMHIDAQAARIAELEAQIAAASAPADTDKLREAIANISNNQITEAWESCGGVDGFYKSFGYQQFAHAILDLAADTVASTALQAPVREVPEGWQLVPTTPTTEMFRVGCEVHDQRPSEVRAVYSAMLAAASVQEPKP